VVEGNRAIVGENTRIRIHSGPVSEEICSLIQLPLVCIIIVTKFVVVGPVYLIFTLESFINVFFFFAYLLWDVGRAILEPVDCPRAKSS